MAKKIWPRRVPTDTERLNFMSTRGLGWDFTNQMSGGLYDWTSQPPHTFHKSLRSFIDAAIRASKNRRRKRG